MKNLHFFILEVIFSIFLIYSAILYLLSGAGSWVVVVLAVTYPINTLRSYFNISESKAWGEKFSFLRGYKY
ncbi:hypothetical protein [Ammoniphilus resinae]|nr:hypothetical protein [Ammoniphilus resinae]